MEDFEKNRVTYVNELERNNENLRRQLQELQGESKWIPQLGVKLDAHEGVARVTLSFGGKNQTATFPYSFLADRSVNDAVTSIIEQGFQPMINDMFKPLLVPEITRLKNGIAAIQKPGL